MIINPSWANTLSFLVGILDKDDPLLKNLVDWIAEIESPVITKFEPDKVETELRARVFKRVFEYYKEKKIRINRDKFDYEELARFGQSDQVITFLMNEIEHEANEANLTNAMDMLRGMQIPENLRNRLQDLLVKYALSGKDDFVQNRAVLTLADLHFNSREVVDRVVAELRRSKSDWVRYALYYFLHTSNCLNEYVTVFLEGISPLRSNELVAWGKPAKSRLADESIHLNIGLQKVTAPGAIKTVLENFGQYCKIWRHLYVDISIDRTIRIILDHAADAYPKDPTLFAAVLSLFQILMKEFLIPEAQAISVFFDKTDTRYKAFQTIYQTQGVSKDSIRALAALADEDGVRFIVERIEQQNLGESDVYLFRSLLGPNAKQSELLTRLMTEKFPGRFKPPEVRDWARERNRRRQSDINLLFDKQAFIRGIKAIFETEQRQTFTHEELLDVRAHNWDNPYFSDLVLQTMIDISQSETMSREALVKSIAEWDWDWFIVSRLYHYWHEDAEAFLSEEQTDFVDKWCYTNLGKVDFRTALVTNPDGGFSASWLAIYLWYFLRKMNLSYPKNVLLDMLSFSWVEGSQFAGFQLLEDRLPEAEISARVLQNLQRGIVNDDILKNHLDYCRRHAVREVLPYALNDIANPKRNFDVRRMALETFLALSASSGDLEALLPRVADDFRWTVVEELCKLNGEPLRTWLSDVLKTENEEEQLKAAKYLMRLQDINGLRYYVDWIKRHKRVPIEPMVISPIQFIRNVDSLPLLIELLGMSYEDDLQLDDFAKLDQAVLITLKNIALTSEANRSAVKKALEDFIAQHPSIPNVNYLYIFLENLEQQFGLNRSTQLSVREVVKRLEVINLK